MTVAASPTSSPSRTRTDGAARIARWLLEGPAQRTRGTQAGGVAGWVGTDRHAEYVYPEITGYYLQWLASMAEQHGRSAALTSRAQAAARWISAWLAIDVAPPTRVYAECSRGDWRNDAMFCFDLAMVLRGLGSASRCGMLVPAVAVVDSLCAWLSCLINTDGELDACMPLAASTALPNRWSTRRGGFLAKAAAGILDAARILPSVPAPLREAAMRTFDASIDAFARSPHAETHPFLYAIEGFLSLPDHAAFTAMLPRVAMRLDELLARAETLGRIPEICDGGGVARLDIVAQAVRAGLIIEAHVGDNESRRRRLDALIDRLAHAVGPDGSVPFTADAHPTQFNVWAAMFAEQALELAQFEPDEMTRWIAAPCIV